MTDNSLKPAPKWRRIIKQMPPLHLALAGTAVGMVFLALLLPSGQVQANRQPLPLATADFENTSQLTSANLEATPQAADPEQSAAELERKTWQELTVQKGDNLAKLFERAGVSPGEMHEVLESGPEAKGLTHIFPGQKLAFQLDDNGQLMTLRYEENQLSSTEYHRDDSNFVAAKTTLTPEVRHQFASGTITSSLYKAGQDAGLTDGMILQMANIFSGVVDFVLDLRTNDHFTVMYDEYYLDGKKIGNGPILAAEFTAQDKTNTAYRYVYADGEVGYFSPEGVSMRKTFMRAPLDFIRISSPFSMNRMHPLFKVGRPHRGIDYAAPVGTPVYAAGDGHIVQSGFSESNGNFIVIEHSSVYTTKYLHLSKRIVAAGQRVKQHQIIGLVGQTGWATGPHLHYEFLVNGVHTNPATIASTLPSAEHIAAAESRRFGTQVAGLKIQFAAYAKQSKLAATDASSKNL